MIRITAHQDKGRALGRGLAAAALLALCFGGAGLMIEGLTVPVEAEIGQHRLEVEFRRQLAANIALPAAQVIPSPSPVRTELASKAGPRPIMVTAPQPLRDGKPIARLTVDRLEISQIVLSGDATHEQLDEAPAMIKQGDPDSPVTVLAAHRDTHFLFIRDLRAGDEVKLQSVTGEIERYRVTHFETVRSDDFAYPLDPATPLLALATCYPFGGTEYGGPWRRVAWAERIA